MMRGLQFARPGSDSMMQRRPILAGCLVVAIFATAVLGVPGGRVICVGEAGHLAVSGAHAADRKHECCCEDEGAVEGESVAAAESDCSDWSLDAQHLERAAAQRADVDCIGPAIPPIFSDDVALLCTSTSRSTATDGGAGGISRAHLALIGPVILVI